MGIRLRKFNRQSRHDNEYANVCLPFDSAAVQYGYARASLSSTDEGSG